MNARQELINYIKGLNAEQVEKLCKHLPLLEVLGGMHEDELIYSKVFLTKLFGRPNENVSD